MLFCLANNSVLLILIPSSKATVTRRNCKLCCNIVVFYAIITHCTVHLHTTAYWSYLLQPFAEEFGWRKVLLLPVRCKDVRLYLCVVQEKCVMSDLFNTISHGHSPCPISYLTCPEITRISLVWCSRSFITDLRSTL